MFEPQTIKMTEALYEKKPQVFRRILRKVSKFVSVLFSFVWFRFLIILILFCLFFTLSKTKRILVFSW